MEVENIFVSGANRGIGLEFVRQFVQLSKPPRFVFATYRDINSIKALENIRDGSKGTQVVLIQMDVGNSEDIERAQKVVQETVGDEGLTLLINNAGVAEYQGFPEITEEDMLFHYSVNTLGPVMLLKALFSLLQKSASRKASGMSVSKAAVLNLSSSLGSISEMTEENPKEWLKVMGYRTSKAALNMAMRVVALTVKDQGVLVVNMCPGWVKTDMGTESADLEASESISAMMKTLSQLDESHHGAFLDRNGKTIHF
ncbi:c-factor [Nephila pilipes]|uniref:C-factor n=1 Tax=Nephila pilipes TaxID=299642 RepID=A0A8X6T445_NEPPI|nr:c-factor [Nephila pilipes]